MKYTFATTGTCARQINLTVEDGRVMECSFEGGCHGNTQGVSALVKGMKVAEVVERLKGIKCKDKATSCPDQLAQALCRMQADGAQNDTKL